MGSRTCLFYNLSSLHFDGKKTILKSSCKKHRTGKWSPVMKVDDQNINHNDFRRISTQGKLINDDFIKDINRLKLYRVKL